MKSRDLADELLQRNIIRDSRIYQAMCEIDRSEFVLPKYKFLAHIDEVLPSGEKNGFIISTSTQPSLVVQMIQNLNLTGNEKVLDIGTGTGYATLILAKILKDGEVISIEYNRELHEIALRNFERYGVENITCISGDGFEGYSLKAPYDAIISMVACETLPVQWIEQLKSSGGRIVAPIVFNSFYTPVYKFTRRGERIRAHKLIDAVFMSMKGQHEYRTFLPQIFDYELIFDGKNLKPVDKNTLD